MAANLFTLGEFVSHSGLTLPFKIDCDALNDADIATCAKLIAAVVPPSFGMVEGIPRGGLRLAEACAPYITLGAKRVLLVDDVWTTGNSMREAKSRIPNGIQVAGAILFARSKPDKWVMPLFTLSESLWL